MIVFTFVWSSGFYMIIIIVIIDVICIERELIEIDIILIQWFRTYFVSRIIRIELQPFILLYCYWCVLIDPYIRVLFARVYGLVFVTSRAPHTHEKKNNTFVVYITQDRGWLYAICACAHTCVHVCASMCVCITMCVSECARVRVRADCPSHEECSGIRRW